MVIFIIYTIYRYIAIKNIRSKVGMTMMIFELYVQEIHDCTFISDNRIEHTEMQYIIDIIEVSINVLSIHNWYYICGNRHYETYYWYKVL